MDFAPESGNDDAWEMLIGADCGAIADAGGGIVGKEFAAATPAFEEFFDGSESDALPPESFFDEEASDDGTGEFEAGLGAEHWLLTVLAGAFPRGCEGGLLFAGTAKLFSAVGMFCGFEADDNVGTVFEFTRATAEIAGCASGSAA